MRDNSDAMVRRYWARIGALTPKSFSAARQ
jgi:hypothetical protein